LEWVLFVVYILTTNQKLKPTHRATDVLLLEGTTPPAIMAKFQYGSLGMASMASLVKEEVGPYKRLAFLQCMTCVEGCVFCGRGGVDRCENRSKLLYCLPTGVWDDFCPMVVVGNT